MDNRGHETQQHFWIQKPYDKQCILCRAIDCSSAGESWCGGAQFIEDWVEENSDPYMKEDFKSAIVAFLSRGNK